MFAGNQTPGISKPPKTSSTDFAGSKTPAISETPSIGKDAHPGQTIGLIQTGDHYPCTFNRLTVLGYSVELVPPDSGLDTFRRFRIIYLSTAWADEYFDNDFQKIEARAYAYLDYLRGGGSLLVEQPNPIKRPGNSVTPTILPYPITFEFSYDEED